MKSETKSEFDMAAEAAAYIKKHMTKKPEVGIILGSGLGELCDEMEKPDIIPYEAIPNFPVSLAPGHEGRLYIGKIGGKVIAAFKGRFHLYEGYSAKQVAFPVRVMKLLGVETLISTNAAGGLNPGFYRGALMVLNDHINMLGANPLTGPNDERFGERFPDMLNAYTPELIKLAHEAAREQDIELFEGVYYAVQGPNFETPAELRMMRMLGGDIIGWSTVPETLAARHMKMKILAITLVTDMSVPDTLEYVDAQIVLDAAKAAVPKFVRLITRFLELLPGEEALQ